MNRPPATQTTEQAPRRPRTLPRSVRIVEVGPRDGLQNEAPVLPTADKIRFVERLAESGLTDIEVSSFVRPDRVPQLADADEVFARLARRPGVRYTGLVANERGLERAIAARADGIALFTAASEAFAMRNIGRSVAESLDAFSRLAPAARSAGLWVRAYISTAFHCPFEGRVAPRAVRPIVERLLEMAVDEISIGDTIGRASPPDVEALTEELLGVLPLEQFAYHFHDTGGAALANVETALGHGISSFDSSAGGLGGCPFAPGAPGNLATEGLLGLLSRLGIPAGVDVDVIRDASRTLRRDLVRAGGA